MCGYLVSPLERGESILTALRRLSKQVGRLEERGRGRVYQEFVWRCSCPDGVASWW